MMTLNPHFNAPEQQQQQQYSGSVPVEYFRPSVSLFVDDEKNKKKKKRERGRETIFDVMHDVMWS